MLFYENPASLNLVKSVKSNMALEVTVTLSATEFFKTTQDLEGGRGKKAPYQA